MIEYDSTPMSGHSIAPTFAAHDPALFHHFIKVSVNVAPHMELTFSFSFGFSVYLVRTVKSGLNVGCDDLLTSSRLRPKHQDPGFLDIFTIIPLHSEASSAFHELLLLTETRPFCGHVRYGSVLSLRSLLQMTQQLIS